MNEPMFCAICDGRLSCRWSDTHGVGVCGNCGLPYRLYHYENDVRVDKPPTIAVKEAWLPLAREYWRETHSRVFPGAFDFMNGRHGRTYSGASYEEMEAFDAWLKERKDRWPVEEPESVDAGATPVAEGATESA